MTTTTTRRSILAGAAAAVPALAMPAGAAPVGKISFPDLAARFASVYARWFAQCKIEDERRAAFNAKVEAATGISRRDEPPIILGEPSAYWDTFRTVQKNNPDNDPVDEDGCSIVWNEIHDELFPLVDEILQQPARSIADLALQAQAFALAQQYHWTDETDGREVVEIRALIESVCKFCGVDPLPGVEIVQFTDDATVSDEIAA
jgi:hypothetical protein